VAVFAATAQIDAAGVTKAATLQEYAAKRACVNESNFKRELKNVNFHGEPRWTAPHPKTSKSRTIVLWRTSQPPDLSALNAAERQAIEEACSYAKLMESPEAYNGCLAKELALRGDGLSGHH
jgi:hypothetical protein